MSQEMAMAFISRVSEDSSLQSKLASITGNVEGLRKVAADAGFNFTTQEWRAAAVRAFSDELGDDELEQIAGGLNSSQSWLSGFLPTFNAPTMGDLGF